MIFLYMVNIHVHAHMYVCSMTVHSTYTFVYSGKYTTFSCNSVKSIKHVCVVDQLFPTCLFPISQRRHISSQSVHLTVVI